MSPSWLDQFTEALVTGRAASLDGLAGAAVGAMKWWPSWELAVRGPRINCSGTVLSTLCSTATAACLTVCALKGVA